MASGIMATIMTIQWPLCLNHSCVATVVLCQRNGPAVLSLALSQIGNSLPLKRKKLRCQF
jgi:hypothetical protein